MKKINFSIITATYNRREVGYLGECIRSIQKQMEGDFEWEHIIIDDGSTDGTKEFVKEITREDSRIKYFFQNNQGLANAVQHGIKRAKGDYVILLDDDDSLTKDSLKKRTAYIKDHPELDWFYAKAKWVNGEGKKINIEYQSQFFSDHLYERMLLTNCIHSGTPVVKRKCLVGIVWPSWLRWSQDYFLWLELLRPERKLKVGFLDDYVLFYRVHSQMYTKSYANDKEKLQKKLDLNIKIRMLHGGREAFFSEIFWEFKSKNWQLEYDKKILEQEVSDLKLSLTEKDKALNEVLNSKTWRLVEKLRKQTKRLKNQ